MLNSKLKPIKTLAGFLHYRFSRASFDTNKDYFKILGIQKTASDAEIKSAFYSLAKKYHPDCSKGYQKQFQQINEAYTVLSDPAMKKEYQQAQSFPSQKPYSNYSSSQQNQYNQDPFQSQRNVYGDPYEIYNKYRKFRERQNRTQSHHYEFRYERNREEDLRKTQNYLKMCFGIFLLTVVCVLITKPKRQKYEFIEETEEPGKFYVMDTYDPSIYKKDDLVYYGTPYYQGKYPILRPDNYRH